MSLLIAEGLGLLVAVYGSRIEKKRPTRQRPNFRTDAVLAGPRYSWKRSLQWKGLCISSDH
jgi:hypothetical protein